MDRNIAIFDSSLGSDNLGDEIIMNAINNEIFTLLPGAQILRIPTHEYPKFKDRFAIRNCKFSLLGGTNLLSSNMENYRQWKISFLDSFLFGKNVVLMGVGWWQYQDPPSKYTKILLRRFLSEKYLHSVRDQYTVDKLNYVNIKNAIKVYLTLQKRFELT